MSTRRAVLAALTALAVTPVAAGGMSWFPGGLDAAREAARRQRKLVLVDCWANWCRFCHLMDEEVWSDPELARSLEREVVPIRAEVDVAHGRGLELAERYRIDGLPVILLIDPGSGEAIERLEGMQRGPALLAALDRALGPPPEALPAGEPPPTELLRLAERWIRAGRPGLARRALDAVLARDGNCSADAADDAALLEAGLAPERAGELLETAARRCTGADRERVLWDRWTETLRGAGDAERLGRQLEARAERFPDDGEAALEHARWLQEAGRQAATVAEAQRAAGLLPGDTRPLVLLADALFAQGEIDAALAELDRAIAIDPHDPELRKRRVRFRLARRNAGS